MTLADRDIRSLRAAAHKLKPVVLLGKAGLSDAVLTELNAALDHHELIKVKIPGEDRDARRAAIEAMAEKTGAQLVQVIGRIAVLYRAAPKDIPKTKKPRPKSGVRKKPIQKPLKRIRRDW